MIVVIQRVSEAKVTIDNVVNGEIGCGLMLLAGFEAADTMEDLQWTAGKIVRMRIFPDENNVMNKSILDVGGDILLVSQFTLQASTKKETVRLISTLHHRKSQYRCMNSLSMS